MSDQAINIDENAVADNQGSETDAGNRVKEGSGKDDLYGALIAGDWIRANLIIDSNSKLAGSPLTSNCYTALHVAATAEETKHSLKFVTNLVNKMSEEHLLLRNKNLLEPPNTVGNTAFHMACVFGNTKMAEIMMNRYQNLTAGSEGPLSLLNTRDSDDLLPLSASALAGKYCSVKYLYDSQKTSEYWTNDDKKHALLSCVMSGFFDIAFKILEQNLELVRDDDDVSSILAALARKPEGFTSRAEKNSKDTHALKLLKKVWEKVVTDKREEMCFEKHGFEAAKAGNTQFIAELLRKHRDLALTRDDSHHTIFHIAVIYRHRGIYNLLYEIGEHKNTICGFHDTTGNNMLHLVGLNSKSSSKFMAAKTSGASLLMQRELLWFKDVYDMIPPSLREEKNNMETNKLTPYELFSEVNSTRVSEGLQWIKDCMVVATLIITVAFAVGFTVPGGYSQETGLPVFIHRCDFLVFVIADAVSLFSASTSLLVFLSILTSGYEQLDFLLSLPKKLLAGLLSLFISVAAMMVTFSASFFVLYHHGLKWVPILIAAFACMPVIVFAILQFHILVDMYRSMCDSRYLFNSKRRLL